MGGDERVVSVEGCVQISISGHGEPENKKERKTRTFEHVLIPRGKEEVGSWEW